MAKRTRPASASRGDDTTLSRWVKDAPEPEQPIMALDLPRHVSPRLQERPAVRDGRTFYPRSVKAPGELPRVLVSGLNNVKIGRDVRKGAFRGYWIYTLSLEERASCPRTCHHWATCYGNNMPYAKRVSHEDPHALQAALWGELRELTSVRGRRGVMVRLHALGDFFSPAYVQFWGGALEALPTLAIYGYTAWAPDSPIGRAVADLKAVYGDRFAIRWSNGAGGEDCALPVSRVSQAVAVGAIVCPEQTGKTLACATCALCWGTRRNIAFLEH